MAFSLEQDESFSEGIRRIAVEQLEKAASRLSNPKKVDFAVHEARKNIKKVRGVLRLVQPDMPTVYRAENGQLRALGRGLSEMRDHAAMLEVFATLTPKSDRRFKAIRQSLKTCQEQAKRASDRSRMLEATMTGLRAAGRRAEVWPVPHTVDSVMEDGFQATYRRGQKALQEAVENPTPENLHRLRKRVKEHRYHLRLLSTLSGETKRLQDLHRLEMLLGDDHNLSVLCARLEQNPELYGGPSVVDPFLAIVVRKQRQLQARALPLAKRLYAAKDASRLAPALQHTA